MRKDDIPTDPDLEKQLRLELRLQAAAIWLVILICVSLVAFVLFHRVPIVGH